MSDSPDPAELKVFNAKIVDEFRANGGKVGGPFEGADLLLLTTTGAKSGQLRVSPLAYQRVGGTMLIIGSYRGADIDPAWVHNLRANPQAHVVWGVALSSILMFEKEGLLEAYAPAGLDGLKPTFRDAAEPPRWTGMDAYLSLIGVNAPELAKAGAKMPASWDDLTQPQLKGKLVMPNPASSGTGYLQVAAWLQGLGEDKGEVLQVMDDLRAADVDFLTIGQYLQPTPKHHAIARFVAPEEFRSYAGFAAAKGFLLASASPPIRHLGPMVPPRSLAASSQHSGPSSRPIRRKIASSPAPSATADSSSLRRPSTRVMAVARSPLSRRPTSSVTAANEVSAGTAISAVPPGRRTRVISAAAR